MSVGETLSRARQERGLSVEDVTAATRIRSGLVRAIESDEFAPCGGAVYARGHIRNISRVVGIDPEPLVAEFDRMHSDEQAPVVPTAALDQEAAAKAEPKRANWTAAMAVALAAICILAAVSLLGGGKGSKSQQSANDNHPAPRPSSTSPAPTSSPPPGSVAQLPPNNAVAMVRVVSATTWLQVWTLDGRELYQGLLTAGQSKVFKNAKGLRLLIGNAPAVDLVANGHDIGAPRSQGNVAHVTIQRGDNIQFA